MREKKKTLKLKKFKVANLRVMVGVRGGNSNPCQVNTGGPSQGCQPPPPPPCTQLDSNCSLSHYLSDENNTCDLGAPTEGTRCC
jgi:hypothetical protein